MFEMASMPRHLAPSAGCWPAGVSRAVFAFAVHAGELRGQLRLLREQLRIFGRGRSIQLQQHELAAQLGRQRHLVPAMALFGQRQRARGELLVDEGAGGLGVVGDIGFHYPLGVRRRGRELEQFGIGPIDKCLGLGRGGRFWSAGVLGGSKPGASENQNRKKQMETHGADEYIAPHNGNCVRLWKTFGEQNTLAGWPHLTGERRRA